MLFITGAGLSHNLGAQLTCRFFAGFFGGPPFSVAGGSLSDMWNPLQRIITFSTFTCEFPVLFHLLAHPFDPGADYYKINQVLDSWAQLWDLSWEASLANLTKYPSAGSNGLV